MTSKNAAFKGHCIRAQVFNNESSHKKLWQYKNSQRSDIAR
jgi:hypothetical protein